MIHVKKVGWEWGSNSFKIVGWEWGSDSCKKNWGDNGVAIYVKNVGW